LITKLHLVEASGPTERAKRCVDAKINTLESEGKCSPSSEKLTKRASQFDQQTQSLECEAFLINLKELVEKRKEKAKSFLLLIQRQLSFINRSSNPRGSASPWNILLAHRLHPIGRF